MSKEGQEGPYRIGDTLRPISKRFRLFNQGEEHRVIEVTPEYIRLEYIRHKNCKICEAKAPKTILITTKYLKDIKLK